MKKSTKDRNVLRAMTIGIAVMMATATPMSVFAAEENGVGANDGNTTTNTGSENQNTSNTTTSEGESASVQEIVTACETAVTTAGEAKELTAALETAIKPTSDGETTIPKEDAEKILADLPSGADFETIASDVNDAKAIIKGAITYDSNATTLANTASDDLDVVDTDIQTLYGTSGATVDNAADSAITNAQAANDTAASETDARAAASAARSNLATAEGNLATIEAAYSEAQNKLTLAETELASAEAQRKQAAAELAKAHTDLQNAKTNATAANEKMKGIKAIVDDLDEKAGVYAESVKELESMRDQYYAMLLYYHSKKGSAVYNEDGTLNVEASAKKTAMETYNREYTFEFCREMTSQMVEYMVMHDEKVDPATADFKFGVEDSEVNSKKVKGETVQAREATVFTNAKQQDQVATKDPTKAGKDGYHTDYYGNVIKNKDTYDLTRYLTNQGDSGRTNFFVVTYKDKDGNEITRRFNYILKDSQYQDAMDFEKGTIYLAEITKGEDGKYVATRLSGKDYVMDDYQQLQKAIEAQKFLKEYDAVKEAADAAAAKVDELEKQIAKLESISVDNSKIVELKGRLEAAQGQLDEYKLRKESLETKVAEAHAAVAAIDLSRFGSGDSDTSDGTADDATDSDVILSNFAAAGGQQAGGTGVLGVRNGGQQAGGQAVAAQAGNTTAIANQEIPRAATVQGLNNSQNNLKKIKNNEIPLAEIPMEEGAHLNWMWLLIIFLLGATGKKMYDEYKKKMEAAEAAKNNEK